MNHPILYELHRLIRRHMALCDVNIHNGSLESGWTSLTLGRHWRRSVIGTKTEC